MKQGFFAYKKSQISYYCIGNGPDTVFCFHGYGEQGSVFDFLDKYADNQYSFYAIDLPFHGDTVWNEGLDFTHTQLEQIIEGILGLEKPGSEQTALTLLGFSLGGRIALSYFQSRPASIKKLVLLAPDGLTVNFWYWLATQTWAGNRFFAFTMKHPGWFFGFLKIVNKLGLVNSSIFKFVKYYIGDKEVRRLLYARWTSLRKLKPNLSRIKNHIRQNNTLVRLAYGKHDRIILATRGEKFRTGIEEYCKLVIIASGHQVLHEKHAEEIIGLLLP